MSCDLDCHLCALWEQHDKCKIYGNGDYIMCDKECKCQVKKPAKPRAFQLAVRSFYPPKVLFEGIRFSDGSGVIRYTPTRPDDPFTMMVPDLDRYLRTNGYTARDGFYELKWTDEK